MTIPYNDKSLKLTQLLLCPSSGQKDSVDITNLMAELTIYEDMYATCVAGELVLNDGIDLISTLPISGFEYLNIIYEKPGVGKTVTKAFRVYKPLNRIVDDNHISQLYSLQFCSEEHMVSISNNMSKSYKGMSVTDMVTDVMVNQLKTPGSKLGKFDKTEGQFDLIIGNMTPFRAINMMMMRSVPVHMFFENRDGYQLRNLDDLVSAAPMMQYRYSPPNYPAPDAYEDQIRRVITYEIMDTVDTMRAIDYGMFGSRLIAFDLLRWKATINDLKYADFFNTTKHLEKGSFDTGLQNRLGKAVSENIESLVLYYPTNMEHNTDQNIAAFQPGINQNLVEKWLLQRQSRMEQLHMVRVKLVVPGTTEVTVGDVIEFGFPALSTKLQSSDNTNPYLSGRYLVTAIRHKFSLQTYEMIMEVIRDSHRVVLPAANNSDANLSKLKGA